MAWEGFDIETSGLLPEYALQPWRCKDNQAWMTTYALATQSPDVEGGHMPTREFIQSLAQRWVTERTVVCAWNAKFEASWLFAYGCGDLVHKVRWLDGMLLWKHLEVEPEYDTVAEKKRYFGLKLAVAEFMPEYAGYEEDVDFHDESPEARAKLLAYNKIDAMTTLKITRMLYERLQESPRQLQAALIETAAISLVAEAAYDGMELDRIWLNHLGAELDQQAHDALTVLAPHGVTEKVVRSPKQLSMLLFETWGLEPIKQNTSKKTGNVTNSTDKEVLHELALVDERAKHLHLYREALGNKTKFVDNILTAIDYNNDGRAHPLANIFGTYSGRMTYTSTQGKGKDKRQIGWALHQQKRGEMYRNVMIAPEGYTLCEFDAAGQEFRWMAILSGDSTMQALCAEGEDAHGYMGAEIAHVEYRALVQAVKDGSKNAKGSRQLGKLANLSLQYRTSANKLRTVARAQYGLPMELPEAQMIHATYLRNYPGVPAYWSKQIAMCTAQRFVQTLAGRRVKLPRVHRLNEWSVQSTTLNYPVQGVGADQKYLALATLKPYMVQHGIKFALELHDGIYLYIPDELVGKCVPEIKHLLGTLPYAKAWGFTPPIPLPFDAKTGKSWGNLKDWEGK